jgi:hypothetical protein
VYQQVFQIDSTTQPILGCSPGTPDPYPPDCTNVLGAVDSQGNISLPQSSIIFPPATIDSGIGPIRVDFDAKNDGTGTINAATGDNTATVAIRIRLTHQFLPPGCGIGDQTNGITVATTSGSDGSLTGIPYDQTTGASQVVNQSFDVPTSSGCGFFGPTIDAALGLPSHPPNNEAVLGLQFTPVLVGS